MVWFLGFGARGLFVKPNPILRKSSSTWDLGLQLVLAIVGWMFKYAFKVHCLDSEGGGCTVVAGLWTSDSLYGYLGDCNLGDCKLCVGVGCGWSRHDKERALASYGWFEDTL